MPAWPLWFRFVVAVLATWRLAHLIAKEDGPFDVVVALRRRAGQGVVGSLMDCPHCLGIWIAVPFAFSLASGPVDWVTAWLGVSGGASLLEHVVERSHQTDHGPSGEEPR